MSLERDASAIMHVLPYLKLKFRLNVNSGASAHGLGEPQAVHFVSSLQRWRAIRRNAEVFEPWPKHVMCINFDWIRNPVTCTHVCTGIG